MPRHRLLLLLLLLTVAAAGFSASVSRLKAAAPNIFLVLPAAPQSNRIDVLIRVNDAANLGAWELDLHYDPTLVTVTGMTVDPAFAAEDGCNAQSQRCAVALGPIVDRPGTAKVGAVTYGKAAGLSGSGTLAILHLQATGNAGETTLTPANALLTDVNAQATTPTVTGGTLVLSEPVNRLFLPNIKR